MKKEIEIKIQIDQAKMDEIEAKFPIREWVFEKTYGFFSPTSIQQGIFPRIKVSGDLSISGLKIKKQKSYEYFERDEYEFRMGERSAISMWKALGFTEVRVFEKLRKVYDCGAVDVCLDRLPFGLYIEIEGNKKDIEIAIKKFNLKSYPRITKAYLKIADELGLKDAVFGDEKKC